MEKGFIGCTKRGGHLSPNSTVDLRLIAKKAQKKEKKKKISLTINHPIDHFKENSISFVWNPITVPSEETSFPQILRSVKAEKKLKKKKKQKAPPKQKIQEFLIN